MTSNSLAIYNQFDQIQKAASALQASGYFKDVTSQAQAIVKVMAGAELGLPPFASMTGIHIIQGKPALGANVIATLVKNDPRYDYRVVTCTNDACTIAWFESGQKVGESGFTMAEAKAAGLTGKDNWQKFPSDMLFARAITRGARRYAPGIFGGAPVYTPEELGADVDPEGYIETTARDVTHQPADPDQIAAELGFAPKAQPAPAMTLEMAATVTNSEGVLYTALDTTTLVNMANSLEKVIKAGATKDGPLTPEQIEERKFKRDAAREIIKSRQQQ